ncbi:MAG: type II secretion system protein N [Alphaproteobacteria bacterium]|nr:type II secretion system protein N [Alphaproteobacteria bacterium]
MRRPLLFIVLGVVLFAAFAVANLPARLIFDAAAGPAGLRAGLVQGTVWDATILRLDAGGPPVAETRARLQPGGLLGGSARFDVTVRDATVRGEGVVTLRPGGATLEDATGVMALSRLPLSFAVPPGQSVQADITRIAVDRDGTCLQAEGSLRTAALAAAGESFGAELPLLTGELLCAGDRIAVQIDGANDRLSLSGRIRLEPAGPAWRIEARTRDREVVAALSLLGFEQDGPDVFLLDSQRQNAQG